MNTYGFIGLGLIGGSLAKMIRKNEPDARIICYSRNKEKLLPAVQDKIIDSRLTQPDEELGKCDIIFLCTPVLYFEDILFKIKDHISDGQIITDVGSVKVAPAEAAKKAGLSASFIGGHPMAGSEKTGYKNSDAELLKGCTYILTPAYDTPPDSLKRLKGLLTDIGCNISITTPELHDYAVAGISHLPHLSAVALTETIKKADTDDLMMRFAATGFRDTTRIAASSPEVWEQICTANSGNIVKLLDAYIDELTSLKNILQSGNGSGINEAFRSAGEYLKKIL